MADIFLSYARADEAVARRVAKAFQSAGLDVWWDADLPAHRAYSEVIERNLEEARAVVVLWSAEAAKSQWVRAEADVARNAGKLVQANLDATLPPIPFNQIQCASLKGWRGSGSHAGWAKLNASVQSLLSGKEVAAPAAAARTTVKDRLADRRWWALAALLLVASVLAAYYFMGGGEDRKPVLAILPFASLSGQDESLAAGMWEDTRQAIGRNPQLIVLGPNTAKALAEKGQDAVAKTADYLLEASVRTAGNKIRVSADLVRTKDGEQLWSQDFDRSLDDVFALQSEIASTIEGRIRGRLAVNGGTTPEHIATSGEVYALYSDARAKLLSRDNSLYPQVAAQLERVLTMDPNFAPAWATLSQAYGMYAPSERNFQPAANSEKLARRAIELAPNLAEGHSALAFALNLTGPVARAEIEKAVELDPNDYQSVLWLGNMQSSAGDKQGALESYSKALDIEPLFWPAVLNKYGLLVKLGDTAGIADLLDKERRAGAPYFAEAIRMNEAHSRGDPVAAANIGLAAWKSGGPEARTLIGLDLWQILLKLGFIDEASKVGPAPPFAAPLWHNDPKGLDMLETHEISPRDFFSLSPLAENAGRVYLLSGRGAVLANRYLDLKMAPEQYRQITETPLDFLYSAPLVVLALKGSGHPSEAAALLAEVDRAAQGESTKGSPESSALLARVRAVQGRNDEAIQLLNNAIQRNWLPQPPLILNDIGTDPAFALLKSDPRFEPLRKQILSTLERMRAQVNIKALAG